MNNDKAIALIPARGGSKGIPHKNIKPLMGKPLIGWTIDVAKQVKAIEKIVVSTDDEKISEVARQFQAEVLPRPAELAQDHSPMIDTIMNVIDDLEEKKQLDEFRIMVLLQPTSPLRSVKDITDCLELMKERGLDSVATFSEAALNPHRAWKIESNSPRVFIEGAVPWQQRQQLPEAYQLNGAVYAFRIKQLLKQENKMSLLFGNSGAVVMPKSRSIDIDEPLEWKMAEWLLNEQL